jgi:hypothetical protein
MTARASLQTLLPTCALLMFVGANASCAPMQTSLSTEKTMSSEAATARTETTVQGELDTELHASFEYAPASRIIEVRYRLRNAGSKPLAVFDRGDQHAIGIGRQKAGEVGIPRQVEAGEDVSLIHAAAPLPEMEPTSPPTPVAIEVAPGAELSGQFQFALKGVIAPKRLRWCVGVMHIGDAYMDSPQPMKDGTVWRASFAVVDQQKTICTPWYDVAAGRFES